jgi:TPR repeat protein
VEKEDMFNADLSHQSEQFTIELPQQIDPTLHQQLQLRCPQYKYKKEELVSLDTTQKHVQIKLNAICITTYIAKYAQSTDEKLMLLHILNQAEYAMLTENTFTGILNREINYAKSIDQQYDAACLIAKYKGRGTLALKPDFLCFIGSQCKDSHKAFNMYLLAAQREYKNAQLMVALSYETGKGIEVNKDKACYWAGRAAEDKNNSSAHYTFGKLLLEKKYSSRAEKEKHEKEAFIHLKIATSQGDKEAQYLLGLLYFEGKGTRSNKRKAFQCFQELLPYHKDRSYKDRGELFYVLGKMYFLGWGTRCNERKGLKYLEKSANEGDSDAQLFFLVSRWNNSDEQENVDHLEMLASKNTDAKMLLATIYFKRANAGLDPESNLDLAYNMAKCAAETGDPMAQFQLAKILDRQKKTEEALAYLSLASRSVDRNTQRQIASFYWDKSDRTSDDEERAISLYLSLANRGDTGSMIILTEHYLELNKNEEADHWLRYLEHSNNGLALMVIDSIRMMREANMNFDQVIEGLAPIPKEIEEGLSATLPLIAGYVQTEPQFSLGPFSNGIPLSISQHHPEKRTNPKLLRQLARQAHYTAKRQREMDAITQRRKNQESVFLHPHNLKG